MANLFELAAKLTLDSSDYEKGIEAAKQAAANFSKGLTAIVTATQNADKVVNAAADSAEQFSTQTSNAADSAEEFRQAETQVTRAAEESANSMSDAADEAKDLSRELDRAESEFDDTEDAVDDYTESADDAAKSTRKLGDEEEKTTKKTSTFGDTLKAILTSDAIKAGLSAVVNGVKTIGQAFINIGKQAVDAYGNYEQLAGGIKKLYGDASNDVMNNAKQAYMTSGLSANQYMEQATRFSAALVNSLGGNTKEAARLTDVAMRSISDNFNTFGTDIESVQNAFQGFAKSNFTMLDNLSLGYGGTKSEMERLIKDANQYAKTIGEASDLSIDSFADIVKAIELVQKKQGIYETTSKEAATTIQGSLNMTKAAWENLLVGIADENADFDTLIDNLVDSATAAGENLIPRVEQVIGGIGRAIEKLLPIALEKAPKAIVSYAPQVLNALQKLVSVIYTSLGDTLVNTDWNALGSKIADGLNRIDWVTLFGSTAQILGNALVATLNLLSGFIENVDWFKLGVEIFYSVVAVVENIDWQEVVATAFRLLGAAIGGAGALIGGLSVAIKSVFDQAKAEVKAYFDTKIKEAGGNVVKGIFNGIIEGLANVGSWIYNNIFLPFINGFKAAFGINSPSTVMMTMGKYIVEGLLNGVKNAPSRVLAIFSEIKSRIVSWGSGILTTAKQIGGNLMTGLIGGINNKVGLVYKKISDVGNSVVSKVKNVFGVHSPSTVMKQIGDYLMQGLSIGVDSNAYKPIRSVSNVGDEMTRAFDFDSSIGRIGGAIGVSAYDSQRTNTERLLMLILETLRDMDESMFERISAALDGMAIDWNDRELGRFVKSYA